MPERNQIKEFLERNFRVFDKAGELLSEHAKKDAEFRRALQQFAADMVELTANLVNLSSTSEPIRSKRRPKDDGQLNVVALLSEAGEGALRKALETQDESQLKKVRRSLGLDTSGSSASTKAGQISEIVSRAKRTLNKGLTVASAGIPPAASAPEAMSIADGHGAKEVIPTEPPKFDGPQGDGDRTQPNSEETPSNPSG
jgi:hypothetical protein